MTTTDEDNRPTGSHANQSGEREGAGDDTAAVPAARPELSSHQLLAFLERVRAAARDDVEFALQGHAGGRRAAPAFWLRVGLYASTYDRRARTRQRRRVRTLRVAPVYALDGVGEPVSLLGFDVEDTAVDDTDLSHGYVAPLAKGVDAVTALRTVHRRVRGEPLPRAVERDNKQRRWARQGNEQFADVLEEREPNTRGRRGPVSPP